MKSWVIHAARDFDFTSLLSLHFDRIYEGPGEVILITVDIHKTVVFMFAKLLDDICLAHLPCAIHHKRLACLRLLPFFQFIVYKSLHALHFYEGIIVY